VKKKIHYECLDIVLGLGKVHMDTKVNADKSVDIVFRELTDTSTKGNPGKLLGVIQLLPGTNDRLLKIVTQAYGHRQTIDALTKQIEENTSKLTQLVGLKG